MRDDQDQSIDSISSDSEDQQPISPHYPASRFEQWVWNCPLPPPGALAQYEETLPGAADRLLKMIETESSHRRDMESRQLESEIRETRWGQWMAFSIALATIGAGAYVALHDAQIPGAIIGSGGVIGLAAVFISGRSRNSNNP